MVIIDRVYAGGAVQAIVQGTMTPTVPGAGGTFTVNDDTGWPVTGKFAVKLNRGLSDEEHIVCDSRSGTTFTVGQRGADGTNAQAHDNPTCEIYWDARSANLVVDHIDDIESDPHATKLLNNARHDLPARHSYGASAAYGTRPTPVAVGTALSAGSGSNPAAGDHVHELGVGSIDNENLFSAGVVGQTAIGANAVGTGEIIDGAVTSAKILDGNVIQSKIPAGLYIPIGGIITWGTNVAPTNFQLLDGSAISRTTFAALFALWGVTFGAGDGVNTFNVPDVRQRFILNKAASGTGNTIGATGGAIDHVHNLDTATAHAKITAVSGGSNNAWLDRKTVASWNSVLIADWAGVGGNVSSQTIGAGLGGNSAGSNPPYIVLHSIVRTL